MMRTGGYSTFIMDQRGGVAVEFVALLPAFVFLTFFVFEITIAVLWVGTVEKAAQLGARLAIVSDLAVTGLSPDLKNGVADGHIPGDHCDQGGCTIFAPRTCTGGSIGECSVGFTAIFSRMDAIATLLQPENVTITYAYVGLGFAGGPIVPRVTVTIQNVPYDTFMTNILARFMRLATGDPAAVSPLTILPTIAVTLTGEDLDTGVS